MTLTTYDDVDQRSEEWLALRTGMVTASIVGGLVTTKQLGAIDFVCPACNALVGFPCLSKRTSAPIATLHPERAQAAREDKSPPVLTLADGKTTRDLAAILAAERIAGPDPDASFFSRDMERGVLAEYPAREKYAEHYGAKVTECGFMVLECDDYSIGVSPDGLVGDDGGLEIKSPRRKGHLLTAASGVVPAHHMAQIQTALLVSGRKWWDFVSYSPGLKMWVTRVTPDPEWFRAIHAAVGAVEGVIAELITDYEAAVAGFPMTDRLPDPFEVELKL